MKLERVLDQLNSFEKNAFLKIIDTIITSSPSNRKEVDKILSESKKDIKSADSRNVAQVFQLIECEFKTYLEREFEKTQSQFDILIDIIIRDGNCILSREWLAKLYETQVNELNRKVKEFKTELVSEKSTFDYRRIRDYQVYKACLEVAYMNDLENNLDCKITSDEQAILTVLARRLELSQEEKRLINYSIITIAKLEIDQIINDLKNCGILFYSKKTNTGYIPDEIVTILRKIRHREVADKHFRRLLKLLKDSQINQICKNHNISRQLTRDEKIREIISQGVVFSEVLANEMFKESVKLNERKAELANLIEKGLQIHPPLKGSTLPDKISNLISHFEEIEREDKVSISVDGYDKLLADLAEHVPALNDQVRKHFEFQQDKVLKSSFLLDFNIKPRDVLEMMDESSLCMFVERMQIKTRGNAIINILDNYRDAENLYLENYESIGARDLKTLKDNGIVLKEAELGIKFEDLTKTIFSRLGFVVDENLRKQINTAKNKLDIIISLGNNDLIIIECKSYKETGFNKYSSVSRQIKAYIDLVNKNGFNVVKSLLVAPDFSDEFINECELEYELNLSLITARSLIMILKAFKESKHSHFPYKLLLRDVLLKEDRIIKAITK